MRELAKGRDGRYRLEPSMHALALSLLLATQATTPSTPSRGFDAELSAYAYPYPVAFHELTAQRQALRMAYMDVPPPDRPNGRTVLLLHGKNFTAAYWEPTVRALAGRGFRVIAPDQIGFGKSSKPEACQFSFHALAAHTRGLLEELEVSKVSVVGHSMGGMLAVRFALSFPEATERLVLVNPLGLEDYRVGVPYRTVDEWYAEELKATPESIRDYQRENYYGGIWKPEYESLIEPQLGWMKHADRPRVAWCSALTYDMIVTQPVVHELSRVQAPTLLVIGLRDRTAVGKAFAPKDVAEKLGNFEQLGKKAAATIPDGRVLELAGVGHLPQVEAFEKYKGALVVFLER